MRLLSDAELVTLWEQGLGQGVVGRAVALLAAVLPDQAPDALWDLPLGERDRCLMALREQCFGPQAPGYAECPRCGERLAYDLDLRALQAGEPAGSLAGLAAAEWRVGDVRVRLRAPTSRDQAALAACADLAAARRLLLTSCVLAAYQGEQPLLPTDLPPDVVDALGERLAALDPGAEILLDLSCPACDHAWQSLFEISTYLWAEIAAHVRRLLRDVHELARAYGWREVDILAMSPIRRQFYLEMVSPA